MQDFFVCNWAWVESEQSSHRISCILQEFGEIFGLDTKFAQFDRMYFKFLSNWWIDLKDKRLRKFWKVSGNDLEIVLISIFYNFILMKQLSDYKDTIF